MSDIFSLRDPPPDLPLERDRLLARLRSAVPQAEVLEVGSTAIEGLIGKQDLDLLVRVARTDFDRTRARLDEEFLRDEQQLSNELYQGYRAMAGCPTGRRSFSSAASCRRWSSPARRAAGHLRGTRQQPGSSIAWKTGCLGPLLPPSCTAISGAATTCPGADGAPWLVDPAVYVGCREVDLAMTELFGGFDPAFYTAYESAWPLEPGYPQRREIYNLYHLLNHLSLFGAGYAGGVERTLLQYGGQVGR